MWILLYGNAYTLTAMMGGVNHGHIGLVMRYTLYATISHTPYNVPVDPGGTATVPLQSNTAQHSQPEMNTLKPVKFMTTITIRTQPSIKWLLRQ